MHVEGQPAVVVSNKLEDHLDKGLEEHLFGEVLLDSLLAVKDYRQDHRKILYGQLAYYFEALVVFYWL